MGAAVFGIAASANASAGSESRAAVIPKRRMRTRGFWPIAFLNLGAMLTGGSASACMMQAAIDLHDVEFADVVIIGRISSYEVVLDPVVRERHQKTLARFPDMRKTLGISLVS
ncbi:hypothetical protein AJ87_30695 [Rhizobium yanglingense]|nr:hypothetical protein AJ87_30695 [Rhizobium yanglingense]